MRVRVRVSVRVRVRVWVRARVRVRTLGEMQKLGGWATFRMRVRV